MLHTVNKSPYRSTLLDTALRYASKGEPLLLIEDGVIAAAQGTSQEEKIKNALKNHEVFALEADLKARGIDQVIDGVQIADYARFVDLAAEHKVQNWL